MTAFANRVRRDLALRRTPHCVYRAYDADGLLLYVGCTRDPERRVHRQHKYASAWYDRMTRLVCEWHPDFHVARAVERAAIETEQPEFNVSTAEHIRRSTATRMAVSS